MPMPSIRLSKCPWFFIKIHGDELWIQSVLRTRKRGDISGGKCRPLISAAHVELQVHCEPDVHRRCQKYSDGTPVNTLPSV